MVPHHCTVKIEVEKVYRRTDPGPAVDSGCVILRGTELRVGVRYTGAVQQAPCDGCHALRDALRWQASVSGKQLISLANFWS